MVPITHYDQAYTSSSLYLRDEWALDESTRLPAQFIIKVDLRSQENGINTKNGNQF